MLHETLHLTRQSFHEGGITMVAERMHKCWEIMQCDENSLCPVRSQNVAHCWEWMALNNEFQCHYGLCNDCIVYLCNSGITFLSEKEINEVMARRGLEVADSPENILQHSTSFS